MPLQSAEPCAKVSEATQVAGGLVSQSRLAAQSASLLHAAPCWPGAVHVPFAQRRLPPQGRVALQVSPLVCATTHVGAFCGEQ